MSYTLATAAKATGLNKSTILRAIKSGQINGAKDQSGEWRIEAVELHRVYPAVAELSAGSAVPKRHRSDAAALDAEIEALVSRAGDLLRQQLDEVRRARDARRAPVVAAPCWLDSCQVAAEGSRCALAGR
jgi:excisionase family DNA binding protein